MPDDDQIRHFVFDRCDIRGEIITLGESYRQVIANNPYPSPLRHLLGQCLAASGLLSGTLKFDGIISLQARGEGALSLVMAECSHHRQLRGIVQPAKGAALPEDNRPLPELLGKAVMAITIEPDGGERYQGIVPLERESLAGCLEDYFLYSEQLDTRLWLAVDEERVSGLLLQKLPHQKAAEPATNHAQWETVCALADTLKDDELLGLDHTTLLYRLFHEESARLFDAKPLHFACSCSRERSANALKSLGQEDVTELLAEKGVITIDCHFCNERYELDAAAVRELFGDSTLH